MLSHHSLHEPGLCTYFADPVCSAWHKTFFVYSNVSCTTKAALQAHFFLHRVTLEQGRHLAGIYPFAGNQGWLHTHYTHSSSQMNTHASVVHRAAVSASLSSSSKAECMAKAASSLSLCNKNWQYLRWTNTPACSKLVVPWWRLGTGRSRKGCSCLLSHCTFIKLLYKLQKGDLRYSGYCPGTGISKWPVSLWFATAASSPSHMP